jgi:hypothetical protein
MFRRLHSLLSLLAALLLVATLTLWWRSSFRTDTLVLRTAPSYARGPAVKRVVIRSTSGVAVSFKASTASKSISPAPTATSSTT